MAIGETGVTGAHGQTVQYPVEGETEEEEGRDNVITQNLLMEANSVREKKENKMLSYVAQMFVQVK